MHEGIRPEVVVDESGGGTDLGQPHPQAHVVGPGLHQQGHGVSLADALRLHVVAQTVA